MIDRCPAFSVHGSGRPSLILIHGWACHQGFWREVVPRLARHWSVVTLDLHSHGASSDHRSGEDASIASIAEGVVAVASALELPDIVLVGHSMGGPVAIEAAIRLDHRCRLVIGVDTFTDAAFYRRRPQAEIESRCLAFAADFPGSVAAMARRITLSSEPNVRKWIASEMSRADPVRACAALRSLLDWDIATRWPAVSCPVETVNSAILSESSETVAGLAGLRIHPMERVGHFAMLEDPSGLAGILTDIVRRHV